MQRIATLVVRTLLGLAFVVFGLNFFFNFMPLPPMSGPPANFMGALFATGYMFPMIKGVEILGGLMLLTGRFVPLGLLLLAPIVVNIAAFHIFLTPGDIGMSAVFVAMLAFLGYTTIDARLGRRARASRTFRARVGVHEGRESAAAARAKRVTTRGLSGPRARRPS